MKIVVLDGYTTNPGDLSWDALQKIGDVTVYEKTTAEQIISRIGQAEIVITNKCRIGEAELEALPSLRYIGVLATGYDIIDLTAAKKHHVCVTNVPSYATYAVAQLTIALMLELCFHTAEHSAFAKAVDGWQAHGYTTYTVTPLTELFGKTFGVIGMGRIGSRAAAIARSLGMNIIAYGPTPRRVEGLPEVSWVTQDELFSTADVVSLHCPLLDSSRNIVNQKTLNLMKSTSFLINTSRGGLVDQQALADALNGNIIAGAGLDVLAQEPPTQDNPLLSAKNCILTPHMGWAPKETRERLLHQVAENIRCYLNGHPINTVV